MTYQGTELLKKLTAGSHSVNAPAFAIVEHIATRFSSIIFSYDLAEEFGFGKLTKEWAAKSPDAVKYISLQTRAGAGLTIVGRLSEGTSNQSKRNNILSAYTIPSGLIQMSPSLSLLPPPTASSRLVLQMAAIAPTGPDLALSSTLAACGDSIYSLPDSFVILLSSSPQETIELASVSYHLPNYHVLHVFDHHSSARETSHLILSSQLSKDYNSVHEAMSDLGYGFFDYAGDNEAHTVLVLLNGPLATAAQMLATLTPGLGVVVVRLLQPWDEHSFRGMLPSTVKHVHVIDEVITESVQGGLFNLVFSSTFDPLSFRLVDIKSHKVLPEATTRYLNAPGTFISFISTLTSTNKGLTLSVLSGIAAKRLLFFSDASSGLAGLPSLITATFLSHEKIRTRHMTVYDAFSRVGEIAADRIILSSKSSCDHFMPLPFLLPLGSDMEEDEEGQADFLGVLDQTLLRSHSILKHARREAPVLIFSNWSADELISKLSSTLLALVHERGLRLFILNTDGLATELLGNSSKDVKVSLETAIGYAGFFRLYFAQEEALGQATTSHLMYSLYGKSLQGISVEALCSRTRDALESVAIPKHLSREEEVEAKAITLRPFQFNAIEPEGLNASSYIGSTRIGSRHDAAKHLLFREAFAPLPPPPPRSIEPDPYPQLQNLRPDVAERTFLVTTTVNRRLTPKEYDRNVFHLEFDTQGTGLKYAIGEALGVHGWNDSDEVLEFCEWYGVDPHQLIIIPAPSRGDGKEKLNHTRTIFHALQQQVDLFGKPPKSFYGALSKYAKSREDRMALYFISSAEGSSTFKKLSEKDTVTFAEVLKAYPSARPPIDQLCEHIGDIAPRHYSIASSQAVVGDRVDLLVVTVDWVTPSGSPRYGQCTRYLAGLKVGQKVTVSIKPSVMKLPPNPMQPIIMAGLGTGAAPFRAFMQHRAWLAAQNVPVGPLLYYFGSRHRSQEYLYGEEIEAYIADNVITHAGLAFSRDTKKKIYIQHKMQEDAKVLVQHLSLAKGVFYLCGPTWPVPDIYATLVTALVRYHGMSPEEAAVYLEGLKEEERYVLEVY